MKPSKVVRRINGAFKRCDMKNKKYKFPLVSRGGDSCIYSHRLRHMVLRDKRYICSSESEKSHRKAMLIAGILHKTQKRLQASPIVPKSIQGILYEQGNPYGDTKEAREQAIQEALLSACEVIGCTRFSLGIIAESKGLIIGPLVLHMTDSKIDCLSHGLSGMIIPMQVELLLKVEVTSEVKFVLLVEKKAVFHSLSFRHFHSKHHCIMITGSGKPDVSTRLLLAKLRDELHVPFYAFMDANPDGFEIFCTYKFGSMNRAFENLLLVVPDLIWIGLFLSDFNDANSEHLLTSLSGHDIALLKNFLDRDHINSVDKWKFELMMMAARCKKVDIERALDQDELILNYICSKIPELVDLWSDPERND
jgi:DNA topoisomerase VI subunit A